MANRKKSVRDMSNSELDQYSKQNNIPQGDIPNVGVVPLPPPLGGYPAGYKLKSYEKPDIKGQKPPDPSIAEENARIAQEVKEGTYLAGVPGEPNGGTTTTPIKEKSEPKTTSTKPEEKPPTASPPLPAKSDASVEKTKTDDSTSSVPVSDSSPKKTSSPSPSDSKSAERAKREANPEFNKSVDATVDKFIQDSGVDPATITAEEKAAIRQEVVNQDQRVRDLQEAYKGSDPAKIAGAGGEVAAGNAKIDSLIANAGTTGGNDILGATSKLPNPETSGSPDATPAKDKSDSPAPTDAPPADAAKPAGSDAAALPDSKPAKEGPPAETPKEGNPDPSKLPPTGEGGSSTSSAPSGDTPKPDGTKAEKSKPSENPPPEAPLPSTPSETPKPAPPPVPSGLNLPGAITTKELVGEIVKKDKGEEPEWKDSEKKDRYEAATPAPSPSAVPIINKPEDNGGSNASLTIQFTHVPTQRTVSFIAFLDAFTDTFDAEWSSEKVFGRMDPIAQYKGTTRKINCGFTIPAESMEQAYYIHSKVSSLLNMMYPVYTEDPGLNVYNISAPPLMMVKFNNLIRADDDHSRGLLGWIPSLKYEPNLDSPIFNFAGPQTFLTNFEKNFDGTYGKVDSSTSGRMKSDSERIGWQSLKISFELNVLHTHRLGYLKTATANVAPSRGDPKKDDGERFPYGYRILNS